MCRMRRAKVEREVLLVPRPEALAEGREGCLEGGTVAAWAGAQEAAEVESPGEEEAGGPARAATAEAGRAAAEGASPGEEAAGDLAQVETAEAGLGVVY